MNASGRERVVSAGAVILLHAAMLWLLLHARASTSVVPQATPLATFDVVAQPPPPPPPRKVETSRAAAPQGRAGLTAHRSAIVAPVPVIVPPAPIPAPSVADTGTALSGGATSASDGVGSGRSGTGVGARGAGDGSGEGGTRARLVSGKIGPRDYPKAERAARVAGEVTVAFVVDTGGRVRDCTVATSSGSAALDAVTCHLVEARFRYQPARDGAGNPVSERRGWRQRWWIEDADR